MGLMPGASAKMPAEYVTGLCHCPGDATTVLDNVETIAPMVMVMILGGLVNFTVFMVMVLAWDWRIGLIVLAGAGCTC